MPTTFEHSPSASVITAETTPPAMIHGVRRPAATRVRSDSAETTASAISDTTTPTTTTTARSMAHADAPPPSPTASMRLTRLSESSWPPPENAAREATALETRCQLTFAMTAGSASRFNAAHGTIDMVAPTAKPHDRRVT